MVSGTPRDDDKQRPGQAAGLSRDLFSVRGKIALVTGASSGIGRVLAVSLALHGCHVVVAARRTQKLLDLCAEIDQLKPEQGVGACHPGKAYAVELDVRASADAIATAVDVAWAAFGSLDILINNAGYRGTTAGVLKLTQCEWDKTVETNLRGAFFVTQAFAKKVLAARNAGPILRGAGPCVINISSIIGTSEGLQPGMAAYCASKTGLVRVTQALAVELGPLGIRVNGIAPGIFDSEITHELLKKPWMEKNAKVMVPMQRWGRTDPDLTALVILLASDSSSYLCGVTIPVDGGQLLCRMRFNSKL
eukprot:jgi/Mesen1/4632/ME000240S03785